MTLRAAWALFDKFYRALGGAGSLYPLGSDGVEFELSAPADYADVRYVLTVDQTTGVPVWRAVTDVTFVDGGFGTAFGGGFGES